MGRLKCVLLCAFPSYIKPLPVIYFCFVHRKGNLRHLRILIWKKKKKKKKTAAVRIFPKLFTDLWLIHSSECDQRSRRRTDASQAGKHQIKMPPLRNWMECFQTDSKIGFQFLPSDKLSPVANYSHCQLTLQPVPSEPPARAGLPNLLLPITSTPLMKTDRKILCRRID